mmetsp:Transcript_19299/g.50795  ORF Transcript_19299/g.50795 Transcript_19299/m.50795 type:complete len:350 (-) Transcript_19299:398-1447(-)
MLSASTVLLLVVLPACSCLSAAANTPKERLQQIFRGKADQQLACPTAKTPLRAEAATLGIESRRRLVSDEGKNYPINRVYADLLPISAAAESGLTPEDLFSEVQDVLMTRVQTGLFRSPLTAFLYERGWRDGFARAGFPGIDKEYAEVLEYFSPAYEGVVVDMSCGSGLMTRRLLRSGKFGRLLALDYSEAMLAETRRRVLQEELPLDELTLCRADVAALPLQTSSVDAMHAGAALHCWPRLDEGLAEIARVLTPDGRFFATTFLKGAYGVPTDAPGQQGGANGFRFFEDTAELEGLLVAAGFPADGIAVRKEGQGCAVIRASMAGKAGLGPEVQGSEFVAGIGEGIDV